MKIFFDFLEWLIVGENNFWNIMSGLGTIVAIGLIFFTYRQYKREKINREIAQVNAVIDEIYHNLNLAEIFLPQNEEYNFKLIVAELNNLSETDRYPNPTDENPGTNHRLFSGYPGYNSNVFFKWSLPVLDKFVLFKSNAITHAMATGAAAILLSKRIFLNLGHLEYSLKRMNNHYEDWNQRSRVKSDSVPFETRLTHIKQEYFLWLHFRLLFTLIDIFRTYPEESIYDKETFTKYEKMANFRIKHLNQA